MLKVGRQQLNTQLGTRDVPLQQQAANHMLLVSNHHHASNASSGYDSPPEEAFHTLQDDSGSINSDSSQQAAAQPSRSTMDEWADIFDHCKTAMNGTGPNQAARVPHDQLPTFNMAMTPHLYVPPGGSMAFESVKSMNSEDIEDCMFGSDEDEPPELRGIKVTGLFRTSMDEWSRGPVQVHLFSHLARGLLSLFTMLLRFTLLMSCLAAGTNQMQYCASCMLSMSACQLCYCVQPS